MTPDSSIFSPVWHPDMPVEYRNQIITGDARELAKRIPDESVDLVFTDPPYPREFLPLYGWLAREARRALKPGGYLFAYYGGDQLPDVLDYLRAPGLSYFWAFAILHNGGHPRLWHKQLMNGYKSVLVFTKGEPSVKRWQDTVVRETADKRFHSWGQGVNFPIKTFELLTTPGAVIWEPFAGGGQVPAACVATGRNYVAFEVNDNSAHLARERIRLSTRPLFVMTAPDQQPRMDLFAAPPPPTDPKGAPCGE